MCLELTAIRNGQEGLDREFDGAEQARKDDMGVRGVIEDQLAAGSAGSDDFGLGGGFVRFGVADGDGRGDRAVAFQDGAGERDGLGADGQPPDGRAEVDAGPDPAVAAAHGGCHRVPERAVVAPQRAARCLDQRQIIISERLGEAGGVRREVSQPLRPPRRRRARRSWNSPPRRIARAPSSRSPRPCPDGRAGTAWRFRAPGRSAGCHG